MKRFGGVAVVVSVVCLLAGCGRDSGGAAASPASVSPSTLGEVGTLAELKDAAVAAGYACPNWQQDNVVAKASESGRCSDSDVFSTYLSEAVRDDVVQSLKDMSRDTREMLEDGEDVDPALLEEDVLLVGPNWVINAEDAASLQEELGGQVVRY